MLAAGMPRQGPYTVTAGQGKQGNGRTMARMMRIAGCMSGTSLDGVDVAVLETDGARIGGFGPCRYRPYAPAERETIRAALGRWPGDVGVEAAARVAVQFATLLRDSGGPAVTLSEGRGKDGIRFVLDATLKTGAEGYQLRSDARGATVQAATEAGLFYGAATLSQLLTGGSEGKLPALRIDDAPRFSWRGLMLDSARHFQSLDEIKQVLDAMAEQKLNTFHWHLTDDQGWRMEIKRYPKLTGVGSCRIPAGDGGRDPVTGAERPYCGFYTQEQIREVIAYAAARHIQVIPEIDVPGHATAAIAAYPELGTIDTPLKPLSEWGVFPNLFNTDDSTLAFLENVLEEVIALFPAKYVHVGGDEAVKDQWEASARVQARMREVGAGDEMEMQSHIIKRLETFLEQHDRRLIGWDEILEGGLPPEATVMSWRGTEGGLKAASEGHDVVMSPVTDMYMDYLQTNSPNEPPGRPATIPLARVYGFEPVPDALAKDKQHHILGLQANMFTEHTRSYARLQHNLFPRLAAVAETGWSPRERRDYADFLARLPAQLQRYQAMGIAYAQTPFQVELDSRDDRAAGTATLALRTPLGYDIHYSVDGSAVTAQSPRYTTPLQRPLPERPYRQTRLGTLFHAWVEQRAGVVAAGATLDDALWDDATEDAGSGAAPEASELAQLQERFLASEWAHLQPIEVETEIDVAMPDALGDGRPHVIICKLDAVYRRGDRIEIVDWKTGRAPRTAAERDERMLQLQLYRQAYHAKHGVPVDQIDVVLFYVADGLILRG